MADIVFLHGGGQGGWVWDETIAALELQAGKDTYRTLALDGPGCGAKRDRDTAAMACADINAELVADIEKAGLRDVVLVGHSQAGMHMPDMVALRPDLLRKLIYVSCSAPDPGLTTVEMTGQKLHVGGHPFNDEAIPRRERYRAMFCTDMQVAQAEAFLDKLGPDQWPSACYTRRDWDYSHLEGTDAAYVLCLSDAILPLAWQEQFAERFFARRLYRIDAGHQVMNTRPQALAELLLLEVA